MRMMVTFCASRDRISSERSNVSIPSLLGIQMLRDNQRVLKIQRPSFTTHMRKHVPVTISLCLISLLVPTLSSLTISKSQRFRFQQVKDRVVGTRIMTVQLGECSHSTNNSFLSKCSTLTRTILVLIMKLKI